MRFRRAVALVLFVVLAAFCIWYTAPTAYRPDGRDQYAYAYASRTLRAGRGWLTTMDTLPGEHAMTREEVPYTLWPPLYPMLLAPFDDPLVGARWLNAGALFATLTFTWALLVEYVQSPGLRIGGLVALATGASYQVAFTAALSESVFIALLSAWVWVLSKRSELQGVIALSALATALVMQRYAGAVFIPLGAAFIWERTRRWQWAAAYTLPPTAILAAWLARNYALVGALTGHHEPSQYSTLEGLNEVVYLMFFWALQALLISGVAWALIWAARRAWQWQK